ncbi:hypothetical protein HF086_006305 [Spodoptera exigua]|uniref:Ion transport domain-containing protein n=1 Tax=Spodoptera exigua TaxID=7107 RepID=A0A922S8J0_SPOEX|nr:hypothetical protein HF086_006305 [Spodoptera exigua]
MSQVDVACSAYHQEHAMDADSDSEDDAIVQGVSPKEVGHNIYILCHQLAAHNKELAALVRASPHGANADALRYYRTHTAQIEIVRTDRSMEQIVFPIPEICEYLPADSKHRVLQSAERDDQGSKVADFFSRLDNLFHEMKWQKKLRELGEHLSLVVWVVSGVAGALVTWLPRGGGARALIASAAIVVKGIHLVSIMGNQGTLSKSPGKVLTDPELLYHSVYLVFCFCGICWHPFFFSVLLLDIVYREETLLNVMRSVTRNGRSILLTAVLALVLVYMFSIVGYMFFRDHFLVAVDRLDDDDDPRFEVDGCSGGDKYAGPAAQCGRGARLVAVGGELRERSCDSLIMCIVTTLNQGLRNGGGIGDILRAPASFTSNLDWFPRLRALSLMGGGEGEGGELELRALQAQLDRAQLAVHTLTDLLTDLRDQMTEQRKQKQRIGLLNSTSAYLQNLQMNLPP